LPEIGSKITVEGWRRRSYVHRLHLALQVAWPHVTFDFDNRAEGGATSRDICGIVLPWCCAWPTRTARGDNAP
jgi:hypothetical protein